ncbi:hypothetical protein H0H93_012380 [Arthromyces matolae]|nr:hypothetical protein H0H93_012380 [Arthromyces matolae]
MLPTFMPVATQAAIKGLTPEQVESLGVSLILNNTYHLNLRPGLEVLKAAGGAHKFQGWKRNLLTKAQDSGGFQLVSLSKFTTITEEGALFASPFTERLSQPEESINIQHTIGADIIMQLDDVVSSLTTGPRVSEAMERSVRWLDRCIAFHERSGKNDTQNLFAIVQGGLDLQLRDKCLDEMIKRRDGVAGYAIGGLSGGEEKGVCKSPLNICENSRRSAKDVFWRMYVNGNAFCAEHVRGSSSSRIKCCTDKLPEDRPRYSMGIGFAEDLLVCVALGVDMADCVFPTRTARFGVALTHKGPLNLRLGKHAKDFQPIDDCCPCLTCSGGTSRALLHHSVTHETAAAHGKFYYNAPSRYTFLIKIIVAITLHNITFQAQVMGRARAAILNGKFPDYLRSFFAEYFGDSGYPEWCVNALRSVGVDLLDNSNVPIIHGNGAKWEYAN